MPGFGVYIVRGTHPKKIFGIEAPGKGEINERQ